MVSPIHDYVEGLLGPNFFLWGGAFFAKQPGDGTTVAYHQDSTYWGLHHTEPAATTPHTVVVWMAFTDVDEGNAALRVLPGSHKHTLPHVPMLGEEYVLGSGVDTDALTEWLGKDEDGAEILTLRAGEISIHDCRIAHGSPPNLSDRLRCGLTSHQTAGKTLRRSRRIDLSHRSVDRY